MALQARWAGSLASTYRIAIYENLPSLSDAIEEIEDEQKGGNPK